jgi:hypothetical protein
MVQSDDIGVENIIKEMHLTALGCRDVDGSHLTQDRVKLCAVVKIWVPYKARKNLDAGRSFRSQKGRCSMVRFTQAVPYLIRSVVSSSARRLGLSSWTDHTGFVVDEVAVRNILFLVDPVRLYLLNFHSTSTPY